AGGPPDARARPLELVSQCASELAEADEAAGEREEGFVDVVSGVVADKQSLELVEPSKGALDDPADAAEAGAMGGVAAGDDGSDPALAELALVAVVVVGAVGEELLGAASR